MLGVPRLRSATGVGALPARRGSLGAEMGRAAFSGAGFGDPGIEPRNPVADDGVALLAVGYPDVGVLGVMLRRRRVFARRARVTYRTFPPNETKIRARGARYVFF